MLYVYIHTYRHAVPEVQVHYTDAIQKARKCDREGGSGGGGDGGYDLGGGGIWHMAYD
jgi:hypothetical protein